MSSPTTPDTGHPAVELIEITKEFPGVLANDRISLAVRRGEVHCLLGENGAGKSTLMNILSGMVQPDSGEVRLDGRHVEIHSPKHAIGLGIGMVYQHTSLVPQLTVLENVMLGEGEGIRLNAAAARERLRRARRIDRARRRPGRDAPGLLALGQQQQIEIIKALWRGSKVLILDEPTSMLTPQGVAELEQILARLKEQGLAVIFITHKLHEAISIGDRVTVLSQGRAGRARSSPTSSAPQPTRSSRSGSSRSCSASQADAGGRRGRARRTRSSGACRKRVRDAEPALELEGVTVEPGRRARSAPTTSRSRC